MAFVKNLLLISALVGLSTTSPVPVPAKLDHLVPRGGRQSGFRAGTHDSGVWGANLHSLSPPSRFGANRPSFGGQQVSSSNLNSVVSPNSGYIPPRRQEASRQSYNYQAPAQPVNLYQPPTTTTRRPPPPPPSGLYQTPVQAPPPAPPTGLYETPVEAAPSDRVQQQTSPNKADMFGMPYDFAYGVNDEESGNHYSRSEVHTGNEMRGQYKVLLPDGRTQVVTYFDNGNGFNAEVTYE